MRGLDLSDLPKLVRKFVFDRFLEQSHPPVLEEIMTRFELDGPTAFGVLKELHDSHLLVLLAGSQRILMAHPFSSIASPFEATISNKKYFANCAWDAIAFHVMLDKAVTIDSFCHHCAAKIKIQLRNNKTVLSDPKEAIVFIGVPAARWWENVVNTCSNNMVFFCSKNHMEEWKERNLGQTGETLSIDQAIKLSIPLYKDKMKLDYVRPSKDELNNHVKSMGLTSDFWKL
ncbi:MAG: hypothetical protein AUI50_06015 [Crenarchaeota archaeon 13_1_40CM_2_52_14]|nr:MAG: hypothetical protein AUI50_06015 [Crenarchaeota archaeon 13_1_40CM_2_52_14]